MVVVTESRDKKMLFDFSHSKQQESKMLVATVLIICSRNGSVSTRKDPWITMFSAALGHNYSVQ